MVSTCDPRGGSTLLARVLPLLCRNPFGGGQQGWTTGGLADAVNPALRLAYRISSGAAARASRDVLVASIGTALRRAYVAQAGGGKHLGLRHVAAARGGLWSVTREDARHGAKAKVRQTARLGGLRVQRRVRGRGVGLRLPRRDAALRGAAGHTMLHPVVCAVDADCAARRRRAHERARAASGLCCPRIR